MQNLIKLYSRKSVPLSSGLELALSCRKRRLHNKRVDPSNETVKSEVLCHSRYCTIEIPSRSKLYVLNIDINSAVENRDVPCMIEIFSKGTENKIHTDQEKTPPSDLISHYFP